jgi:heptosyltransferase-2
VSAASTGAWNLAGDTGLKRLTALLKLCRVVVANDSGPLHLAAAVGVAAIGIFGSTDPAATGPRGGMTRVIHHPVPCSPCLRRICKGDFECMNSITPETVMGVIETA